MMAEGRTYRVPRRVSNRVEAALARTRPSGDALDMALTLTSGEPVDLSVPRRVAAFFSHDWRFDRRKSAVAALYGGPVGLEWARRCLGPDPVAAAAPADASDYEALVGYDDDSVGRLVGYRRVSSAGRWQDDEATLSAELDAWLDEVEAAPPTGEVVVLDPSDMDPGVEVVGVGEPPVGVEDDFDLVGPVLSSGRSVTMMREAAAAAAAALAAAEGGDAGGGGASPKGEAPSGGDHHSSEQLRDYHGRFAKVGARVQGQTGRFGRITGIDKGRAVVATDRGDTITIDPKQIQVVRVEAARAVLEGDPVLVEDPAARLEAYREWAAEQLGGTS